MEVITFIALVSALSLSYLVFNVLAVLTHIEEAIRNTEAAMTSTDGTAIALHAMDALSHARAAYFDKQVKVNKELVNKALKFLDSAVYEGKNAKIEAAQEAARRAHELLQLAK